MSHVSQIDLIDAITKHLSRKGFKLITPKQLNKVIEAANLIVAAYDEPYQAATPGMGLERWLNSDETGMSSKVMARTISAATGGPGVYVNWDDRDAHPHDPADLGRCVGLLDAVPEFRPHIALMADVSPAWNRLVENWDELERLYREELPSGKAPKCYDRMRALIEGVETEAAK